MSGFTSVQIASDNGWRLTMESTDSGYLLSNVDLGQPTEEDNTYRIPYNHGETYDAMRFGTRDITLNGHCFNGDYQRLGMVFSPFAFVTLTLNRGGVVRTARGKPNGVFKPNKNPPYDFTAVIRCYDPFFYEPEQKYTSVDGSTVVYNNGGVETPAYMSFSIPGGIEKCQVHMTTRKGPTDYQFISKHISLSGLSYPDAQSIFINTADGNRYVRTSSDDLSEKMTPDSEFFQLPPGRITLSCSYQIPGPPVQVQNAELHTTIAMRHLEI